MVQVQSSWFPLVDRNPQTFVNIHQAKPEDFKAATQRVYRSAGGALRAAGAGAAVDRSGFFSTLLDSCTERRIQ